MKKKTICKICNEVNNTEILRNDFFLRIDSSDKKLSDYKNLLCNNCGTIYHDPPINEKKLINHYQNAYRKTNSQITLKNKIIDLPLRFDWTSVSFHRFHAFYEILLRNKTNLNLKKKNKILDYGCYQGAFLYACKKTFNFKTFGTDYNQEGLSMAKSIFKVDEVFETNKNFFNKKINTDIITLLHVFEHLMDPVKFLLKIKKNVLKNNGLLYLELPNPYSNPLNDPTHLFLYSNDTIRYILRSCNYKIIDVHERGLYQQGSLLRNDENLNLHILAESQNKISASFPKIKIGKKVYSNLIKKRNIIGLKLVKYRLKAFINIFFHTLYSFVFLIINFINPNLGVYIHKKIKNLRI